MSSRCRFVEDTIGNSIRRAMKLAWWKTINVDALPVARQLWEQTHPNEPQIETDIAAAESSKSND